MSRYHLLLGAMVLLLRVPALAAEADHFTDNSAAETGSAPTAADQAMDANLEDTEVAESLQSLRTFFEEKEGTAKQDAEPSDDGKDILARVLDTVDPNPTVGEHEVCPFHQSVTLALAREGDAVLASGAAQAGELSTAGTAR